MKIQIILLCLLCSTLAGYAQTEGENTDYSNKKLLDKIFIPAPQFEHSRTIFASYGFDSNVNIIQEEISEYIPPITLTIQGYRQHNFGTFLTLSGHAWNLNDLPYGYQYFNIGIGGTHRLSWEVLMGIPNLETYLSGIFNYRLGMLNGTEDGYFDHRQRLAVDVVFGAMYHLKNFGVFAEIGSSDVSNLNLGVFLNIKKKSKS